MNEAVRNAMILKFGNLMLANAELGAVNEVLLAQLGVAQAEIARLNGLLEPHPPKANIDGEGAEDNGAGLKH